jgi:hypothetical protein
MTTRARLAVEVAVTAVLLGVLADSLLRTDSWGVNFTLWIAALLGAILLLARRRETPLVGEGRLLAIPLLLFGVLFSWRDSEVLKSLDGAAVLVSLALLTYRGAHGAVKRSGALDYAWGLCSTLWAAAVGAAAFVGQQIPWKSAVQPDQARRLSAVGRGILIAIPFLLLFGVLFASADAVFEKLIVETLNLDPSASLSHIGMTLLCAWLAAGVLGAMMLQEQPHDDADPSAAPKVLRVWLGLTELSVAMGLLNVLFLCFVLVQLRYLFGGAAHVQAIAGLTYAQYARRGFFELVAVAAIMLPLLLVAHTAVDRSITAHRRAYAALAGALVALLFVILGSALQRMRLYQSEFGQTELRFYTTAFMGWLAALFVWFAATVLRDRRERFAFGGVVTAFGTILLLHVLNPDALIARANLDRAIAARGLDVHYNLSLSADARPALAAGLPALGPQDQRALAEGLGRERARYGGDWRTWSWSRAQASNAVARMPE